MTDTLHCPACQAALRITHPGMRTTVRTVPPAQPAQPSQVAPDANHLAGPDGPTIAAILQPVREMAGALLARTVRGAATRAVREPNTADVFTPADLADLTTAFEALIAAGDLLGRARVRLELEHAGVRQFADAPGRSVLSRLVGLFTGALRSPLELLRLVVSKVPSLSVLDPTRWADAIRQRSLVAADAAGQTLAEKIRRHVESDPAATPSGIVEAVGAIPGGSYVTLATDVTSHDGYHEGFSAEMAEPDVSEECPAWEWRAVPRSTSRPHHLARRGNFYPADVSFTEVRGDTISETARCLCSPRIVGRAEWERRRKQGGVFSEPDGVRA